MWFTGLSMAGKTTIINRVYKILKDKGCLVEKLDGDVVRKSSTKDLGFTSKNRNRNIERVTFVAKLFNRNNVSVIASFISLLNPDIELKTDEETIKQSTNKVIEYLINNKYIK